MQMRREENKIRKHFIRIRMSVLEWDQRDELTCHKDKYYQTIRSEWLMVE
jgi:hypothetical protein